MEPDKQVLITKRMQDQINRDAALWKAVAYLAMMVADDKAKLKEMKG